VIESLICSKAQLNECVKLPELRGSSDDSFTSWQSRSRSASSVVEILTTTTITTAIAACRVCSRALCIPAYFLEFNDGIPTCLASFLSSCVSLGDFFVVHWGHAVSLSTDQIAP
jgi:hypothetical protein